MIVTPMCANLIIGNIYVNGTPSVKVVQYHRESGSVFPCRWITLSGIYKIYDIMIEEPANYLKYYVGYLEICRLRTRAEDTLGDKFVLKEFHEFLLTIGPAPFSIIEEREDIWIQDILSLLY